MLTFLTHPTGHLDALATNGRRITTFAFSMDSITTQMRRNRDAHIWFSEGGPAARDLLGMKILLLKREGQCNQVLAMAPSGHWVDITQATDDEIRQLSQGQINPPPQVFKFETESTGHPGADFLIGLFGCAAEAIINTALDHVRNQPSTGASNV